MLCLSKSGPSEHVIWKELSSLPEIIINQSVNVKRTLNRSPIYLLTKFHRKPEIRPWWPNQQKFHKSLGRLRPQVLAQGALFYCKLPQRLQEMKMHGTKSTRVKILFDNGSQRSYVTDNLKSRLGLNSTKSEMLHLNTFGGKNLLEKQMRGSNLVPWGR